MIQEKDFLYRVPVKNALVAAPGKQVRNPEILVDLEGGKFMHGNILDANSTNKLIDQSVKDAIDNSIENSNCVTRDLLEAEKSARTKGDEDLSAKIKAEQTRAEGKEKQISDKLAIVDGDSNTEGSFRKAIADVIAAAPEDLDTLKEIADKLAGNDDLHTALNQAITEKADASALANEVTRATGVENDLRTAIGTKADATALSNYVLTTALNQQINTLNAAISAKQDAGNYIPYDSSTNSQYSIGKNLYVTNNNEGVSIQSTNITGGNQDGAFYLDYSQLYFVDFQNIQEGQDIRTTYSINGITSRKLDESRPSGFGDDLFILNENGVKILNGDNDHVLTSNASTIDITQYALKTDLPTVPTNVSQLTNDSNFITQQDADAKYALANSLDTANDSISSLRVGLSKKQNKITVNSVDVTDIETADITKLRTIVINLIDALSTSGLIRQNSNLE